MEIKMDKMEYLKKQFAHTKGKTFENYIINQLWAKVEDLGLYPITQQYVKRPKGYALLDLYFPQINFAIEVDECAHMEEKYKNSDELRMEEIFSSVIDIEIERIKEGVYDEVRHQINDITEKIKKKVAQCGPFTWDENWQTNEYQEKMKKIKKRGKLLVSDFIGFNRIQVTNDIFNMNLTEGHLRYGKSWFEIPNNGRVWFPYLVENKKWENTISDDWNTLSVKYIGEEIEKNNKEYINKYGLNTNLKIYTFAKYKNSFGKISYRFIGIFKFIGQEKSSFIYKRICNEIEI